MIPAASDSPVLDVNDVARLAKCCPHTIRRLAACGQFPRPVRVGRRLVRWDRATVLAFLAGAPINTAARTLPVQTAAVR